MTYKTETARPQTSNEAAVLHSEAEELSELIHKTFSVGEKVLETEEKKEEANKTIETSNSQPEEQITRLKYEELIFKDINGDFDQELFDGEVNLEDLDSFEKTLQKLTQIRANAQKLSDKDRRDLAAKIALSFLGEDE
jgi:hypothetical protein